MKSSLSFYQKDLSKENLEYFGKKLFSEEDFKVLFLLPVVVFKGSDRLCKVVELSMQCCGKLLSNSFETY